MHKITYNPIFVLFFALAVIIFTASVLKLDIRSSSSPIPTSVLSESDAISPTKEIEPTSEPLIKQAVYIKPSPTSVSVPLDPDPIITCQSKTGNLQVRKSVCASNTDCPDGYGGYIFESQQSCKNRWDKISSNALNAVNAYGQTLLNRPSFVLPIQAPPPDYTQNLPQAAIPSPVQLNINPINPSPCPRGIADNGNCF